MTADKLQQNLAKHLDEVIQAKDQWPTDANQAYEMIAHHVFMAFYDVNAGAAGGATGGSGLRGSSSDLGTTPSGTRSPAGTSGAGSSPSGANSAGSTSGTSRQRQ